MTAKKRISSSRKTASQGRVNKDASGSATDNDHQKTVSGKNRKGPTTKVGKGAGGNKGSRGQNRRTTGSSVGSHKPGGDGPGTKKFKHESDINKRKA